MLSWEPSVCLEELTNDYSMQHFIQYHAKNSARLEAMCICPILGVIKTYTSV